MNNWSRVRRAIENPVLFLRHINRLYHRQLASRADDCVDIFDEDWDTLCILDACRYDMFARRSSLPGRLESRRSKASSTPEFLQTNFDGRDLRDTVYVTANPQFYQNQDSLQTQFHEVVNIWREEGWDEDYGTVLPETVTEYATRAARDYPNKRLLVHYMQPHYPFIDADTTFDKGHMTGADRENVWEKLLSGTLDVDQDEIWRIYEENLDRALPAVRELMEGLDGKTVITADHGNMVGERSFPIPIREWGHPRGIYTEELVTVPWLEFESGPRREIKTGEASTQSVDVDDGVVADRLQHLGYAE